MILGSTEAANLPNVPGRAIWKFGKTVEIQTPYCDPEIAEVKLFEQPSNMCRARSEGSIDDSAMGSSVINRNGVSASVPLLQSCSAAFKQIGRAKKN